MANRKEQPKRPRTTARKVQAEEGRPYAVPTVPVGPEVDEDAWGEDRLTHKQRLFVRFYVGDAAGNASKAARMAGYRDDNAESLRQTARETLTKPHVQRAIERAMAGRFGSAEDVRAGIAAIAQGNAADYLAPGPDGKLAISLEKLAEAGQLGLIHEIREDGFEADGKVTIVKRKLKLYDRLKALELCGRINGQFNDKVRHEGSIKIDHAGDVRSILGDPRAVELANALARRMAGHAVRDGESAN